MFTKNFLRIVLFCPFILITMFSLSQAKTCKPTESDMIGPFYKSGAPVRASVGKGYILNGVVRSSKDCSLVRNAQIEFWLAGPNGSYDDDHRATVFADDKGSFRFESNYPAPYSGRPPHIHIRVSAKGFVTLVTQHYPEDGSTGSAIELVLMPSE